MTRPTLVLLVLSFACRTGSTKLTMGASDSGSVIDVPSDADTDTDTDSDTDTDTDSDTDTDTDADTDTDTDTDGGMQ